MLRCEGGALNGDAYQALDGSGLCITLGQHPGTGCGGLVQQGGHGIAEKVLGLSIDALVECTVVTADGSTLVASSDQNADLFWALRGGCGNFGVVVEFVFAPRPFRQMVPSLQRVHLPIPFLCPSREELVKHWRDNVESAPRDVYPLMVMTPMPTIELFHGVGDGATLESLAAYESFGRPVVSERKERDFFSEISWDSLGPSSTDNLAGLYYPTASLLKDMPDEACKIIADAARKCPAAATLILTPCGGAAADVPKDATAVYHRDVKFWIVAAAGWKASTFRSEASAREEAVAWARELRDALMPYTVGRYGMLGEDAAKEKWGDAADRDADPLTHASCCVEINQCIGCTRQFFTKSFLGDDAAVLARSSGEEPASPRHRAGVASMAWRSTRRFRTNAP